jgi:phage portal protein BeeE
VEHLDNELIELMFYNILPKGNTVLHIIHDNGDVMEELFKAAHSNPEDKSEPVIHIPFLPNIAGQSPIHLCVEGKEYRYINVMLEYLAGYGIDHHSRAIADTL